jgi:hypothetical protein
MSQAHFCLTAALVVGSRQVRSNADDRMPLAVAAAVIAATMHRRQAAARAQQSEKLAEASVVMTVRHARSS